MEIGQANVKHDPGTWCKVWIEKARPDMLKHNSDLLVRCGQGIPGVCDDGPKLRVQMMSEQSAGSDIYPELSSPAKERGLKGMRCNGGNKLLGETASRKQITEPSSRFRCGQLPVEPS
eukprot:1644616-Amphidinium_carterae.1